MQIPGLCRVWVRKRDQLYWTQMSYAPRCYTDCQSLIDYYQTIWGNSHDYFITADHDICRPEAGFVATAV